jgi:hypothetical protein
MKRTLFRRRKTGTLPPDWRELEYAALHANVANPWGGRVRPRVILDIDGERAEAGIIAPGATQRELNARTYNRSDRT